MRIKHLSLQNFRNFRHVQEVAFPAQPLLVAAAPNATGKTNFLESLVVLLRGKSFRGPLDECVRWYEDSFSIHGTVQRSAAPATIAVRYYQPTHKVRIEENGSPVSPIRFYTHYPFVLFLPDDSFLFYRGPAQRRNFFNQALVCSPQYLSALVQYQRSLRQRNAALKTAGSPVDVQAWTGLLAEHAAVIWQYRQTLVQHLNNHLTELYQKISGDEQTFTTRLIPGAANINQYTEALHNAWPYEQRYHYTLYGPHRDDLEVMVDGRPIPAIFSRGQMRSVVIAMKIAMARFVKHLTGEEPVLLFDEALSELDVRRQQAFLSHLNGGQTLLTCTTLPASLRGRSDVFLLDLRAIVQRAPVAKVPAAAAA